MGPMGGGGLSREPNVVPMIDILLVLLIAAILWALPGWKTEVQLPLPINDPTPGLDVSKIVLSIARGPTYAVNGHPIERDRLIPELAKIYDGRPDKVLFIDGARDVSYQDVFWVFGAVKDAGVLKTAILPKETVRPGAKAPGAPGAASAPGAPTSPVP